MTDQATQLRAMCAAKDDRAADEQVQWSVADSASYARGHAELTPVERMTAEMRERGPGAQGTLADEISEHATRGLK